MSGTVVVGGGTAGCVVAARLAEAGAEVTLLEAGPDYGALVQGSWPADLLDATTLATSHDWGYAGHGAAGQPLAFDRARVIAGCSAHNGSTMSVGWRGDDADLPDSWSTDHLAEARQRAAQALRISVPPDTSVQPFQRAFLQACQAIGVPRTDDLLDPDGGAGVSVSPVNVVDGLRWNTAFAYLDPVRGLARLRIVDRCTVDRIVIERGRATAVVAVRDGRPITFDADQVVLCAGAYGTPMVLQRSGIGRARHLEDLDIKVQADLPGVGCTLQDQPVLRLEWEATPRLRDALAAHLAEHGFLPEEQVVAKVASPLLAKGHEAPYDMHVFPWIEPDPQCGWICVIPAGLLRPASTGEVMIAAREPRQSPRIDHGYLALEEDARRLVGMLGWIEELAASGPMSGLLGRPRHALPSGDEARLAWIRAHHGHYWHPTGGAAMGRAADRGAVCDEQARVRGVEGIRVADASLLPRSPRATTAFPVTVIGEQVAGLIAQGAP